MTIPKHFGFSPYTTPQIFVTSIHYPPGSESVSAGLEQWCLGITVAGQCHYILGEQPVVAFPGDVLVFRPNTRIEWRVPAASDSKTATPNSGWEIAYAAFHPYPHWLAWLDTRAYDHGFIHVHLDGDEWSDIRQSFAHLVNVYQNRWLMRDEEALNALEYLIIRLHGISSAERNLLDSRIRDSVELIHRRFALPLAVTDIAKTVGLSVAYFSTLFVAAIGVTPAAYVERVRLTSAADLLRFSETPVGEIASTAGYADAFYFARRFRRCYGQSPTAYRAAIRSKRTDADATEAALC